MYGLLILNDPSQAVIDIVFVHGLHGGRTKTWTKDDVLWPEELLPGDVPSARILTYGYDANVAHFWSRPADNKIDTFSNAFFSQLTNNRSEVDATNRPIIFVAHSLGGIVVANAIVDAATNSYGELSSCIRGIIFLGTPHKGSNKAKWADQARKFMTFFKSTNSELLKDLDEKSEKLAKIGDSFPTLLINRGKQSDTRIEIVCFYEGQPTVSGMIVDEDSATLPGYDKILLDANHSEMCKFASSTDSMYRQVVGYLIKWVKDFSKPIERQKEGGRNAYFHGTNYGLQQYSNTGTQTNNFGVR
ncbi:hypothetical protein FE257_001740 [Aspergillus nanangensis]|uniref:DUF676 domain-containing protein n=1 Tax=Aspergillus nanangensis TaxID=2582783 RepID=A0AAD4CDI1_ASPNN|nr:hypothetical protein FE257_001740 [Aspergillus nanangensis]